MSVNQKRNILIIDDSANMRRIVRRSLDPISGLNLFEAGDGEEGETILQERMFSDDPIDVVVLDWHMPKLTGLEFLRNVRGVDAFKKRPAVIMLTAETYPEQIQACLAFDVTAYVLKPFDLDELREAVEKALLAGKAKYAV